MNKNSITKFIEGHGQLLTTVALANKYGLNKVRMCGIMNHPLNNPPKPDVVGFGGRCKLYDPEKIGAWLEGKDLRKMPYLCEVFSTGREYPYHDYGFGGKAEGEYLRLARDLYKLIGSVRR